MSRPDRWHEWAPHVRGGCVVAIDPVAPGPLEHAIAIVYGPPIGLLVRRLAHVAESEN